MINTVNENEADVSNIVLLVGTNSLPRDDQNNVVKKKKHAYFYFTFSRNLNLLRYTIRLFYQNMKDITLTELTK